MIQVPFHGNLRGMSKPRSIVRLNGQSTYFNNWNVNLNSTHQADDFSIELPFRITRDGKQGYLTNTPTYPSFLFSKPDILVEIFVGFPKDADHYETKDLTRIMYGNMDTAQITLSEFGEMVMLTGRNMVAPFLDNKTTQKFQNMVSSAIAGKLAASHKLKTSITPTYTLTGKYFAGDSVSLNKDITEWDLLTFLADQEGYELRIRDDVLYFGPFDKVVGNITTSPLNYTWGQNVLDMTFSRSPHAAKNIVVEVHSNDRKTGKHIRAKSTRTYKQASEAQTYYQRYYIPGLTLDQAQKRANALREQLSRLEVMGTLQVAGNELLTVDRKINVFGTGSGLSSGYYVRKATHKFDNIGSSGYLVDLSFSNLLLSDENTGGL